jgi:hypothetical protein
MLIDPSINPETEDGPLTVDPGVSDTFLLKFGRSCLQRYMKERLSYNPEVVRQKVEEAKELEKQRFIMGIQKLSEEERKAELMMKTLGIGKWAIGGTKLVYSYDPDQWEKNRADIANNYGAAAGYSPEGDMPAEFANFDPTGYFEGDRAEGEGYDMNMHPENDD